MEQIKTILGSYRHISLEPVFLLFCVNLGLIGITTQDLYLKKACKVNLNHTEAICDNIFNHTDIQVYNYYTHLFDKISLQSTFSFPSKRLRSMSARSRRTTGCCRAPPASYSPCSRGPSVTSSAASPSSCAPCSATSCSTSSSSSTPSGSSSSRWSICCWSAYRT